MEDMSETKIAERVCSKNFSTCKKIEEEIKKLQLEIEKDVAFINIVESLPPMPTWMMMCGVFGALLGIGALFNLVFFVNPYIEDHIINLVGLFIGGGFGLYVMLKERSETAHRQRLAQNLKQKNEKLELLCRLKR